MKGQPFATVLKRCSTPAWRAFVNPGYYLYAVHPSQTFVSSPSLAASLYLCIMSLLTRRYSSCAEVISACFTDQPLTNDQAWVLLELFESTKDDCHPDAHACRLRIIAAMLDGLPKLSPPSSDAATGPVPNKTGEQVLFNARSCLATLNPGTQCSHALHCRTVGCSLAGSAAPWR